MEVLGADPDQLRGLARTMRRAGSELRQSDTALTRHVGAAPWNGRDADAFRRRWTATTRSLRAAATDLEEMSTDLDTNAAQQIEASETLVSDARLPQSLVALPERVETWTIGGSVAAFLGITGQGLLEVKDMPGDHSFVWVEAQGGGFVTGGAGATAGSTDRGAVAGIADGDLGVSVVHRRGWRQPDDDALAFARDRAAEGALDAWGIAAPLGFLVNAVADGITALLGHHPPDPEVVDMLFMSSGSGRVSAALGLPLAGAGVVVSNGIGIRRQESGTSLLLETSTRTSAGAAAGRAGSQSTVTSVDQEIEIRPASDRIRTVVTTSTTIGDRVETHSIGFEVDDTEIGDRVEGATALLSRGEPAGALTHLGDLWAIIEPDTAVADVAAGTVQRADAGIEGRLAWGPGIEVELGGARTVVDYAD